MGIEWFRFSLKDGGLEKAKAPTEPKPLHWIERDLENFLAINPNFLDVADHLPLRLGGIRGTVTSPDQAYIDELGRIVVIEVKRIIAGLGTIAQVISYADHWRLLPPGEIDNGLRRFSSAQRMADEFGRSLSELRSWASGDSNAETTGELLTSLGNAVIHRLNPEWMRGTVTSIKSFAQQHGDTDQLPCTGAPARIIAVAPGFSDKCIEFAKQLAQRMVAIVLVRVDIVKSRGDIYVGRELVHRDPDCEPTWRTLRRAWHEKSIRNYFVINGWADALNRESFSLSARETPDARIWFCAGESKGWVWTVVPSGWHKGNGG